MQHAWCAARYQNQEFAVEVPIVADPASARREIQAMATLVAAFHEAYEREYTYQPRMPEVEIIGIHMIASSEVGKLETHASCRPRRATLDTAIKGRRARSTTPPRACTRRSIYDGTRLEPGMSFAGPAIIEDPGTTVVVHPTNRVEHR